MERITNSSLGNLIVLSLSTSTLPISLGAYNVSNIMIPLINQNIDKNLTEWNQSLISNNSEYQLIDQIFLAY